ncbi:MAG: hypothetical protein CFE33_17740 [Pseudorhodobacter sp. PARRP1]|nr:MAG: hypothetical protein CFE33_17740 [Pseudorhodobacter sp. PARRP1]
MTGGADGDSFVFQPGAGADRITDFDISQDVLNLRSLHFADAAAALAAFSQTAGGAVFSHGGDTVLLSGIDAADLTAGMLLI